MWAALRRCLWENLFAFLTPNGQSDGKPGGLSHSQHSCDNAKTLDALQYALYVAA